MMNHMKYILLFIFLILNLFIFTKAIKKSKKEFYSDTFFLSLFGIYVWGDALILAPFWILSSMIFLFISDLNILKYILFFYSIRSFFEVIYWLNHQSVKSSYNPPFFRKFKWIKANESAILYQLFHTGIVVIGAFFLTTI